MCVYGVCSVGMWKYTTEGCKGFVVYSVQKQSGNIPGGNGCTFSKKRLGMGPYNNGTSGVISPFFMASNNLIFQAINNISLSAEQYHFPKSVQQSGILSRSVTPMKYFFFTRYFCKINQSRHDFYTYIYIYVQ